MPHTPTQPPEKPVSSHKLRMVLQKLHGTLPTLLGDDRKRMEVPVVLNPLEMQLLQCAMARIADCTPPYMHLSCARTETGLAFEFNGEQFPARQLQHALEFTKTQIKQSHRLRDGTLVTPDATLKLKLPQETLEALARQFRLEPQR